MQKKKIIYPLYCCLAVIAVTLFLVLYKNVEDSKPANTPNGAGQQYASSFNLLCPNNITLLVGGQAQLINHISIEPASMVGQINVSTTTYTGEATDGISYSNNIISANSVGVYRISFKVLEDENSYLTHTILVNVKSAEEYEPVKQINLSWRVGETKGLQDLFILNIGATTPELTSLNGNVQIVNNQFVAKNAGQASIKLNLNYEFVTYSYVFNFNILPKQVYSINIINYSSSTITTNLERLKIQYEIIDESNDFAVQTVFVVSSNLDVATVESCDAPFIILNRKSSGTITLTITSTEDSSVVKTLIITFE